MSAPMDTAAPAAAPAPAPSAPPASTGLGAEPSGSTAKHVTPADAYIPQKSTASGILGELDVDAGLDDDGWDVDAWGKQFDEAKADKPAAESKPKPRPESSDDRVMARLKAEIDA